MKILQIAPAWTHTPPSGYGGTEVVIDNLVTGLTNMGHEVTLFATGGSQSAGSLEYVFKESFFDRDLPWEAALPSLLHYHQGFKLASDYDVVHAHLSSQTDVMLLPLVADLADQGIPAVLTLHSPQPFDRFSDMDDMYIKHYSHKITVVNISETMQKFTPKGFKDGGVAYNCLDPSTIEFNPRPGEYLTWLGQILPKKGTHEALLAAKEAGEKIVFAGMVDKKQPISVEYFERKVKPLIDDDQIVYIGPANLEQKSKLLAGAKGFLNPIDWEEPFGMVMAESMAAGTPVISYNRGAAPELILDAETGFLVENRLEMVKAISKLDTIDRGLCRSHIERSFSPAVAAERHTEIYQAQIRRTKVSEYLKAANRKEIVYPTYRPESNRIIST